MGYRRPSLLYVPAGPGCEGKAVRAVVVVEDAGSPRCAMGQQPFPPPAPGDSAKRGWPRAARAWTAISGDTRLSERDRAETPATATQPYAR
jgi:hypothetical protein